MALADGGAPADREFCEAGTPMEMYQVRYFLAVARLLNFTRATEECNVAQPSLTRAIKQLEEEFGQELFRRERNLTHLTEFGRRMTPFLQQCYDSAAAAKTLASPLKKGAVSPLTLAISRSLSLSLIVSQLTELSRAFDGLELRLLRGASGDIAEHLKNGEADIALAGPLGQSWERLESWPLFTERIWVTVSKTHRFACSKGIEAKDLASERVIARTYCETSEELTNFLESQQVQPKVSHRIVSERDYQVLLEANLGVGLMPESMARSKLLTCVPVNGLDLSRTISVYAVAGGQRPPAVSTLLKLLRAGDWPAQIGRGPMIASFSGF
jgi:DNA-binding transcriptional LysR family regulator